MEGYIHKDVKTLVPRSDAAFYWQPNIVLSGVVNTDALALSMDKEPQDMYIIAQEAGKAVLFDAQEVLELSGEDIVIEHEKSKIVTLTCDFDLYIYPFDVQTCNLTMALVGKIKSDAQWQSEWKENNDYSGSSLHLYTFIHFKRMMLQEEGNPLHLPTICYSSCIFRADVVPVSEQMLFQLRVARRFGSHVLVTFLPCFVLQLIGLSVFAVPLDDLPSRLTVSISCLIVMAALFTQISSTLPVSADPKMIDVWMFVHVLMLAVVFFSLLALDKIHVGTLQDNEERLQVWFEKKKVWPMNLPKEPGKRSLSRRVNLCTALLFVALYLAFVAVFIVYIYVSRNNQLYGN
ncbi:glycine receptor subunit alpha-3-like [Hyalella azteca]|uniref:Glycine receptor subunit alpha-3-like n=1 Tax=Hyalella azteca TaxID=294128 RepID=A0A8B7NAP7_HYAAZ|nr:glycine receptor subunit alpha-3-like [Hyalella azteca]